MKKKPIRLLYADKHLIHDNIELVTDITKQEIELAKKIGVTEIIGTGDEFTSRQAQSLATLDAFAEINDLYVADGLKRKCIVGNHSKVDYKSEKSYLSIFKHHPCLDVISTVHFEDVGNIRLHFVSYFDENVNYKDYLKKAKKNIDKEKFNILITHILFNGGVNNEGEENKKITLKLSDFKQFDKVLSGHIHNKSTYGNFHYIGSTYAKDFGETNEKGFTILYDDGSHEMVNSTFPEYYTIDVDLDKISLDDVNDLKKQGSELKKEANANIRFRFKGSKDKVASIKQEEFTSLGIDVKKEHKTIIESVEKAETGQVIVYDDKTILTKFDSFCKKEEYDNIEYGKDCLIKKLEGNESR
jgi:exonuclease SbcD